MIRMIAIICALAGLGWLVLTMASTVGPTAPEAEGQAGSGKAASSRSQPATSDSNSERTADALDSAADNAAPSVAAIRSVDGARRSDPGGRTNDRTISASNEAIQTNRADRNVTPDGMTFGPGNVENLKRIAPRNGDWAPPSPLVKVDEARSQAVEAKAEADRPIRPTLLPRPIALDTAHLKIGEGTIALPGIDPLPLDAECGSDEEAWPCGMRARTAFRAFLRSRSILCDVPTHFVETEATVSSQCTIGGGDIGAWLIQNGWAKAVADGPYADRQSRAQKAGRGVWGRAPSRPRRDTGDETGGEDRMLVPEIAPTVAPPSAASPPTTAQPPAVMVPATP